MSFRNQIFQRTSKKTDTMKKYYAK